MNPRLMAMRAGLIRGWLEMRQSWTIPSEVVSYLIWPFIFVIVMLFMRDSTVPGTDFSLGASVMPSLVGMQVAFGMLGAAGILTTEREDGTLLRAKTTPNGMLGYMVAKVVVMLGMTAVSMLLILFGGALVFGLSVLPDAMGWVTLAGVFIVGMFAVAPIGAAMGSLLSSPRSMGLLFLPLGGLVSISGIFYPITAMPEWIQWIAQVFPVYWLGLGMRAAMLPDAMAAVEIGESWRTLPMLGVLGIWAVLGLVLAPPLLRRMARRESGSAMQERKERAMTGGPA